MTLTSADQPGIGTWWVYWTDSYKAHYWLKTLRGGRRLTACNELLWPKASPATPESLRCERCQRKVDRMERKRKL